ncbi:hypothetical protein KY321_05095 [Candidatus Woesearchaeota archaeon]|nr:hypothetical protein [Candidatus Woesearchaeota archaeon]
MIYEVKVLDVEKVTEDISLIKVEKPEGFNFIPGQHIMIRIGEDSRPFTIASSSDDQEVEFLVKGVGTFSNKLSELKKDDSIVLLEPFGEMFNFDKYSDSDLAFVAGGSGITPFMSILRYVKNNNLKNKIDLFYFNKSFIPYESELRELNKLDNINIELCLTRPSSSWTGKTGYLTKELIQKANPKSRTWFICGPSKMIDSTIKLLEDEQVNPDNVKYEGWSMSSKEKTKMEKNKLYKCEICGNVAQMVEGKPIPLMCCGQEMQEMPEKTEEEGNEKHKPVMEINGNEVTVKVGSVLHPMEDAHYIEMIQVFQGNKIVAMKQLLPGEEPVAKFVLDDIEGLTAKAFCNIHGFWKN